MPHLVIAITTNKIFSPSVIIHCSDPHDEGMLPNALYESNETTTTGNSQAEYAAIDYEQTVHTAPNMSYRAHDQKNKTENLYTTADEVTGCYETPDPTINMFHPPHTEI